MGGGLRERGGGEDLGGWGSGKGSEVELAQPLAREARPQAIDEQPLALGPRTYPVGPILSTTERYVRDQGDQRDLQFIFIQ
jgi:hypothetical protein